MEEEEEEEESTRDMETELLRAKSENAANTEEQKVRSTLLLLCEYELIRVCS